MKVEQIKLSRMETFCYLIGDETSGKAALIDPAFDVHRILSMAKAAGYSISHVINTHHHADHTAGNAQVIKATGAKLCIHANDAPALSKLTGRAFARMLGGHGSPAPDRLLADGETVWVGATGLKVLHTPGHTPGGICLYAPGHVFTGDTLFVGAVGRTDLSGGDANQLLVSIQMKLYSLPGDTIVWPGHHYGADATSTIAHERAHNPFTAGNRV
jgi:hydroxyacylglutathione hydrolase